MFGIKVVNESGSTQIDSTYSALRIMSRGQVSHESAHPMPGPDEILLVRSISGHAIYVVSVSGNLFATSASGLEWLIVRPSNLAAQSGDSFGFRAFNSSGGLVFDSGNVPIAPIANISHAPSFWNQQTITNLPPPTHGRSRFIDPMNMLRGWGIAWNEGQPPGTARWMTAAVGITANQVSAQIVPSNAPAPPQNFMPTGLQMHFLVADAPPP